MSHPGPIKFWVRNFLPWENVCTRPRFLDGLEGACKVIRLEPVPPPGPCKAVRLIRMSFFAADEICCWRRPEWPLRGDFWTNSAGLNTAGDVNCRLSAR